MRRGSTNNVVLSSLVMMLPESAVNVWLCIDATDLVSITDVCPSIEVKVRTLGVGARAMVD